MTVECFIWTNHAEERRAERLFDRPDVERAIRAGHADRRINHGEADWRVHGLTIDGRRFAALYDHPCRADDKTVLVVNVLDAPSPARRRVS
ncbi:MAG: DUF4258 domain-containing protein [Solirubrobacteraceae bacterium]